jgi:NAD(P)H-hydrate epimerase
MNLMGLHWKEANVVVLAGSGGNGGGGICAGRHLANHGVAVNVCLAAADRMSESASFQRRIFQHTDGTEVKPNELAHLKCDLIIDALIGYGLNERPRGTTRELITWANQGSIPILSLDVPSGIEATTGRAPGESIRPRWTLTLALPKSGLYPQNTGELFLADIGIPSAAIRRIAPDYVPPFGKQSWATMKWVANTNSHSARNLEPLRES